MLSKRVCRLLICVVLLGTLAKQSRACPSNCNCDVREKGRGKWGGERGGSKARRVLECTGRSLTRPIPVNAIPEDTVLLDLSNNNMKTIRGGAFTGLSSVQIL
ncbi:adhesion G protein-coupled receptor A2-like [Strongylocentrotus purpuratus]|uniref:LRRNT domain-containing protein n=1 Tax=Strongylocentrotus purpuratus TaxID=7668 RepID=A0A7M7NUC4_STRPU|nr:adhesion G protein-coupled receptor A2-like [Strongylocentrotus purpuratus]